MTEVTLEILKEDIETTSYMDDPCIIDKALIRAGYPELEHTGMYIRTRRGSKKVWLSDGVLDFVLQMRMNHIPRETRTVTLKLNL